MVAPSQPLIPNPPPLAVAVAAATFAASTSSRSVAGSPHLSAVNSTGSEITNTELIHAELGPSDGASKKCHCKRSKCLKLYCECFAANVLCDGCKCADNCENTKQHAESRLKAVQYKLARNRTAFDSKFKPAAAAVGQSEFKHVRGCNCKRSNCRKKYCECFQAGVECAASCRCTGCKNDGSLPHLRNFGVQDWVLPSAREATGPVYGVESVIMILPVKNTSQQSAAPANKKKRSAKRPHPRQQKKPQLDHNPIGSTGFDCYSTVQCSVVDHDSEHAPPTAKRKISHQRKGSTDTSDEPLVDDELEPDSPTPRSCEAMIASLLVSPGDEEQQAQEGAVANGDDSVVGPCRDPSFESIAIDEHSGLVMPIDEQSSFASGQQHCHRRRSEHNLDPFLSVEGLIHTAQFEQEYEQEYEVGDDRWIDLLDRGDSIANVCY